MTRPAEGALAGTGLLARALLRRTRWWWLVWLLALVSVFPATAGAYRQTVPEGPAGAEMARALASNPTMRAILGPPFDLLHTGPFVMWRVGTFMVAAAGIMAVLGVVRGTRAEEEDGRLELLRSGVVGRHAPLAAGLSVALGACLALGALVTLSMAGPGKDVVGATAMGLGVALGTAVWAGVAAVTAQLSESARAARGMALGVLGAAFALRAVADGSTPAITALQWLSPLEWPALTRPYAGERWTVLLLPLALTVALVLAAFALEARRDHGAGLRPARLGPRDAAPSLRGAGPLAWRLDRSSALWWAVGIALFASGMGTLATSVGTMLRDNPDITERFRRMGAGGQDLTEAFYVAMLGILVPVLALLALQLWGVLHREEERGHAELLLSTATSRTQLLTSHVLPALLVPTALLALAGACLALPAVLRGESGTLPTLAGAALVQAPGVWLVVGLAAAVHGWLPRLRVLPWLVVGWSLAMSWLGEVLGLPSDLVRSTPFARLPRLPVEPMDWAPVLVTASLAAALVALGVVGYRRRDLTPA